MISDFKRDREGLKFGDSVAYLLRVRDWLTVVHSDDFASKTKENLLLEGLSERKTTKNLRLFAAFFEQQLAAEMTAEMAFTYPGKPVKTDSPSSTKTCLTSAPVVRSRRGDCREDRPVGQRSVPDSLTPTLGLRTV